MKKILLSGILLLSLNAASTDSDLDGVIDTQDKCPNTPFLELVDKNGCSKKQLALKKPKKQNIRFNVSAGYEIDSTKGYNSNLILTNISAYYKKYTFSYSYSLLSTDTNKNYKSNDSILSFYYKFKLNKIRLKAGLKTYFTTDYNSKTDYALKLKASYYYKKWYFSLSEKHKIYGESGTNDKDTITFEAGHSINKFYISPYIYTENSKYNSSNWSYYGGIFAQYSLNKNLYLAADGSKNLEEDITSFVINIGYIF